MPTLVQNSKPTTKNLLTKIIDECFHRKNSFDKHYDHWSTCVSPKKIGMIKKIMANRRDSVPSGEGCNSEVVCKADRSKANDEPGIVGKEKSMTSM